MIGAAHVWEFWALGKKTKNKKQWNIRDLDDLDRVVAGLTCGNPMDSIISARDQDTLLHVLYDEIPLNEVDDDARWSVLSRSRTLALQTQWHQKTSLRGHQSWKVQGTNVASTTWVLREIFSRTSDRSGCKWSQVEAHIRSLTSLIRSALCRKHVILETWWHS